MASIISTTSSCLQASIKAYSLYTVRTCTSVISRFITIVICFYVFQLKHRIFLQYIIIYLPALFFHKCFTTSLISMSSLHRIEMSTCRLKNTKIHKHQLYCYVSMYSLLSCIYIEYAFNLTFIFFFIIIIFSDSIFCPIIFLLCLDIIVRTFKDMFLHVYIQHIKSCNLLTKLKYVFILYRY